MKSFVILAKVNLKFVCSFISMLTCHFGMVTIIDLNRDVHLYLLLFLLAVVLVHNCISLWVVLCREEKDNIPFVMMFMRQWDLSSQPNLLHKIIVERRCGEYMYAALNFLKDS